MSTAEIPGDDDDFGDFGGFEAADPVEPQVAQPVAQASPSPWALFPGSSAAAQPGAAQTEGQVKPSVAPDDSFQTFQKFANAEAPSNEAKAAVENSATENGSGSSSGSPNKEKLVGAFDDALADDNRGEAKAEVSSTKASADSAVTNNEATKHLKRLQDKLFLTEQDKTKLQSELEEVQGLQEKLQGELIELQEQTVRYEKLQAKHAAQLEDMRKAGHDALLLIVEEYKELCRTAVLQQQESSRKEFQEYLQKQNEREQEKRKEWEQELSDVLKKEKEMFENQLQEELSKMEEKYQEKIQTAIAEERETAENLVKKVVEEEREHSKASIEKALQEERDRGQANVDEQKIKFDSLLKKEQENSRDETEKCLGEERAKTKEQITQAFTEERSRSAETQKQIKSQIKTDLMKYVQEQKEEDQIVRKRQLASVDLFLESARHQLKLLMGNSEEDNENS